MSYARAIRALLALGLLLAPGAGRVRAEGTRLVLELESGAEFDSNALRAPSAEPAVGSPLWRLQTRLELSMRAGTSQMVTLSQAVGSKLFLMPDARGENVIVDDTRAAWSIAATRSITVDIAADYYDAFQQGSKNDPRRDFRRGSAGPRMVLAGDGDEAATIFAGYRAFQYKATESQDYWGPYVGAAARKRWLVGPEEDEREWQLEVSYQLNLRSFNGNNILNTNPPTAAMDSPRSDVVHFGEVRGTWTGPVLLGLGYGIEWNDSSSYGYGWVRHLVVGRFAAPLPGRLQLAGRAMLQILQLSDAVPFDQLVYRGDTFDAENRSSIEVALERPLGDTLRLVLRYSYFASLLGASSPAIPQDQLDYARHLVFVGVAYRLDR